MRFSRLILLYLLFPVIALAQGQTISGKVVRADTKNPVAGANVFFNSSSYGTTTSSDGTFTLNDVRPGQYTLVVSHLGYSDNVQTILVSKAPIRLNIELAGKSIMLKGVTITTKADWKRNYELFVKQFIGTDENAKNCQVMNPDILDFTYYGTQKVLLAEADRFLIVENHALGYRVKFLIDTFRFDGINGLIIRGGHQVFEELPGTKAQKQKWRIARNLAYYGSPMHFFRALYQDRLIEEGFEMHRYIRYVNQERPPENVIQRNIDRFKMLNKIDSANKWIGYENMSRYAHENYYPETSFVSQVFRQTDRPGVFAFTFPDCMCIQYLKKQDDTHYKDIYLPLNQSHGYETSILTFLDKENFCLFDMNGIIMANAPLYEGTWSKNLHLSLLLPVDYQPTPEDIPAQSMILKKLN